MKWVVQPSRLSGFALVPGDKSISHRALMLSALATGTSVIRNLAPGGDVVSTADCLRSLGIQLTELADATIVTGGDLVAPSVLDAGNSGTTLRLLSGILAACPFTTTITGDDSLRRRPMDRVIEPLTMMGASVTAEGGRAPLVISGGTLTPVDYTTPIPSAQVKSCIPWPPSARMGQRWSASQSPRETIRSG